MRGNIMIHRCALTEHDKIVTNQVQFTPADMVNDEFDYSKVIVKKPWGYEYLIFENNIVAVWILYIKANEQTSMHCHPGKKTSLLVMQGQVICSTLDAKYERNVGDGLVIEKGVFHQTRESGGKGAFVMEVETPVN